MYSILLLDDRPQVRTNLAERFKLYEFNVYSCKDLYEANDIWKKHGDELNAIVLDMMMPSSGIKKEHRKPAEGGLLSGWIWLWNTLNPNGQDPHPIANKCIVIYSGYLDDFNDYINSKKPNAMEKEFAKSVNPIEKDFFDDNEKEIVKILIEDRNKKTPNNS
jgi:hypothetical protein